MSEKILNSEMLREKNSRGNDKMLILEDEHNFANNSEAVEDLMREFAEELKPVGIACKSWAKANPV